jgi:hypothetical protein
VETRGEAEVAGEKRPGLYEVVERQHDPQIIRNPAYCWSREILWCSIFL